MPLPLLSLLSSRSDFLRKAARLPFAFSFFGGMYLAIGLSAQAAIPVITSQPASQTIFYGDPVTFRVSATGTAPLSYQWLRNGAAINAATASAYTLSSVSSNDQAVAFSVKVSNASGAVTSAVAVLTVDCGVAVPWQTNRLLDYASSWKYDSTENLDLVNWTAPGYDDSLWLAGPGLLASEDNAAITPLVQTPLADPRAPAAGLTSGHAYYFRTTVLVPTNALNAVPLLATFRCDDGAVVYLNGNEAKRIRMPNGGITNQSLANDFPPFSGSDASGDEFFSDFSGQVLAPGTNVIAVSVHQQNTNSSDLVWGMSLDAVINVRLRDTNAPVVTELYPAPGTVPAFGEIEIHFSEGVLGITTNALLINGKPATNCTVLAPDVYVFGFPQPPAGSVQVAWNPSQLIVDLSANSNRFAGASYSYDLDPLAPARSVLISEFMAGNTRTLRDDTGQYSDWLELYNSGDQAVDLGGWHLTDNPAKLTKWQIPAGVTLQPRAYLLIWASGLDYTNPAAPLHTSFKLDKGAGHYLGLVYSDGASIVSAFWPYLQQHDDVSYGRDLVDPSLLGYYSTPTPGQPNATVGPGFGPAVQFSRSSGTFIQPLTLALTTADTNAVIRYFLVTNAASAAMMDVPNASSPVYTAPLTLSSSTQVRARAFPTQAGYLPGPLHSETYLQLASGATSFSSDIPIVVFHNMGAGAVAATADQFMTMQVFDTRNGRSSLQNPPDLAVQGIFHRRGQASFGNPKPNLRVETRDAYGQDLDVELLGMPSESDWIFYGINTYDKVLMHNPLSHGLYRQMGHYTSRTRYVEVFIQTGSGLPGALTSAHYNGLYVLEEKIKIAKQRVDIDKLHETDTNTTAITGSYLLSIDKSNPGSPASLANASIWYLDPDYYEITSAARTRQKQYIDSYLTSFYAALTGSNWRDPQTGYAAYIDLPSWIDYHLHQTFVFNADMLRISSYFYKPRNGKIVQGPLWDFDRAFANSNDGRGFNPRRWRSGESDGGTDPFNAASTFNNPWYGRLFTDPDFWQRWIDRYQELRRDVYTLTNLYQLIDRYGNEVREATTREYARWTGSGGSDTSPRSGYMSADGLAYTFPSPGTWQGEINFTKYWFSNRLDFMDSNFLNPPVFSNQGGLVSPGFQLTITAPTREANSTIYYTLDGTDPRMPGGSVSPKALSALNQVTLTLTNNARVFARNWNGTHRNLTGANNPPLNSYWSGPQVATFVVSTPTLAITELMYHPVPPASGTNDNDQFEFIELKNVGANALNLVGMRFTNGIDFTFTATNAVTNLAVGQYLVVVKNQAAFRSRYPQVTNIAGEYAGSLNNGGERLCLEGALKEPILDFRFDTQWYPATDGAGFSLVIRNESAPFSAWTNPASWRPSTFVGGSPGQADPAPSAIPPVLITEVLSHTDPPEVDSIELYNPTPDPAPIGGWFLTDDHTQPMKFMIPTNTVLPAGQVILFTERDFNTGAANSFALSSFGEEVYLFSGNGANLTGYRHGFQFGSQVNGVTFGRCVTSDGLEHFVTEKQKTLGQPNAGPKVGPVVINEIMHAPPPFGLDADTVDEYIELRNITSQPALLFDPLHPTNAWKLDGAVQYTFAPGLTLAPWSYLLVVSFDPAHDPASLNWFRNRYGLATNVPIVGPFQGHLANEGERVGLYLPDKPELPPSPIASFVPYVLAEEVHYSNQPPWPAGTDGTGQSLQRIASLAFGDDPANWQANPPSPGAVNPVSAAADTDHDGLPDEWKIANGLDPRDPTGSNGLLGDPDGDSLNNWQEFIAGTNPQDRQDTLKFNRAYPSTPYWVLEFTARPGRTYSIEKAAALGATNAWTVLADNLSGTNVPVTVFDPLGPASQFYRLRVTPKP